MLLSDLIPFTLFTLYAIVRHYPSSIPTYLWGPILSRLCSLVYHANEAKYPPIIYLDYLGICSMAFSVPAACALAEDGWGEAEGSVCGPFNAAVAVAFGIALITMLIQCGRGRFGVEESPAETAILVLGLLGNLPVLAIIVSPNHQQHTIATRLLFASSLVLFAVGFFILKNTRHILWHWAAALAQAAGVAGVELGWGRG